MEEDYGKKIDELVEKLKEPRKYHILLAIILHLTVWCALFNVVNISVQKTFPISYCPKEHDKSLKIPEDPSTSNLYAKCSKVDYCKYKNTEFIYIDHEKSLNNWTTKFDLTCENEYLMDAMASCIFLFTIFSKVIVSPVSDKYGRRIVFIFCNSVIGLGYLFLYAESNIYFLFTGIILIQLANNIMIQCSIYFLEFYSQNYYTFNMGIFTLNFGLVGLLSNAYTYYFKDLRNLSGIFLIISITLVLLIFFFLVESPEWVKKKYQKYSEKDTVERLNNELIYIGGAKKETSQLEDNLLDKKPLKLIKRKSTVLDVSEHGTSQVMIEEDDYKSDIDDETGELKAKELRKHEEQKKPIKTIARKQSLNMQDVIASLFTDKKVFRHFIIACLLWVIGQLTFYGLIINLNSFNETLEYASLLSYIVYIVACLFSPPINIWLGRRGTLIYGAILSVIFNAVIFYLKDITYLYINFAAYLLFFYIVGSTFYIYIPELFPTYVRSTAVSYSKIPSKLVLIVFPFLLKDATTVLVLNFTLMLMIPFVLYFCHDD